MHTLQGSDMQKAKGLFEKYSNNQSVIFSVFENHNDGCVYADAVDTVHWAVLQTMFAQHFIAGEPTKNCADEIENILFDVILSEQSEKEIVAFSVSDQWDGILQNVFRKRNGVSDGRKIFDFSLDLYRNAKRPKLSGDVVPVLEKRKTSPFAHADMWSAKIISNGQTASYCNVIMVGHQKAEIDIHTGEAFRGKGYATAAAFMLIDKLLAEGLTPAWSAWPFRMESRHIATKLGFVSAPDAMAWIWQEGM